MLTVEQAVQAKAIELGKLSIRATTAAKAGHPTTALSLTHLVTELLYRVMRWDPAHPRAPGSDRLVLSEGHAVPIIYAACADLGVTITPHGQARPMTHDDLMALRDIESPVDGHPNPEVGFPFFDAATGSLGQGLSVAAGLAAAARLDGIDKTIYCIVGDGESREGQIWEAMDFIADHELTNVVAIFNCNTLAQSDYVSPAQDWVHLQHKAEAFGWTALETDGHDPAKIDHVLRNRTALAKGKPLCIVARTVKGWGVPDLGGMGHHGTAVKQEQLEAVLATLDRLGREFGVEGADPEDIEKLLQITPPPETPPLQVNVSTPASLSAVAHENATIASALRDKKMMSPRRAYGTALKMLGAANPHIVALDADVKNSTYAQDFAAAFPDRYFEARIAEQNMVSAAAGLASGGKIPFVSTFGRFLERAFDQIEMAIIGGANLKLVGTHIGVTLASDGPSQMGLADVAFMRAFAHVRDSHGNPAMTILTPSDGVSAYGLVLAMAETSGACYLRAVRSDLPVLYPEGENFPLGAHKIVRRAQHEGAGCRLVFVASGYLVHSCLKAAKILEDDGVDAAVVDAYSLPANVPAILALAGDKGCIIAVEDNYVGGLSSELAETAATIKAAPAIYSLTVERIPKSGRSADDVLHYVGIGVDDIVETARHRIQPAV
ncbi:transketolase [Gluconacetobacter johannae DSM 13595]|uniref:Transketolase n=2 Tax=Gluconacetobacter johannae TaxID=112140 RepID=A0A7W4P2X5_9PROT|nr:transketolase [Gluconacetobacter johannae]GBQ80848.1 transketolase [Gluconacetobacter johannae DSM 13595]